MIFSSCIMCSEKKFQIKMTLFAAVLVVIMTIMLSIIAGKSSEKALKNEASNAMYLLAKESAKSVGYQVVSRKLVLEGIAADSIICGSFGNREATFDEKLEQLNHEFNRVKNLGFIKLGIVDKNYINTYHTHEQVDVKDRGYVKQVFETGQTVVTSTLPGKLGNNVIIIYATPIRRCTTREIIGVLTGVIDAKAFSDSISTITYKKSGYGIVLDNKGTILAHKDYRKVLTQENIFHTSQYTSATPFAKMAQRENGIGDYTLYGVKYIIAYHPVQEADYTIGITAPEYEVFAKAREEKFTLFNISMVIIFITILLAYYVADKINQERERLKKEKKHHKDWLRNIVENSPMAIVFTDKNGTIEYVNPKFLQMTGYEASEIIGKNPNTYKSGIQNTEFYKILWKTIGTGKIWHGEIANRKKDGTIYWEEMYIVPVLDEKGKILNYIASKKDITEQKRLYNELVQTNCELNETTSKLQEREENLKIMNEHLTELVKEEATKIIEKEKLLMQQSKLASMGEMVGMIAHQWRQPLNAISAAAIKLNMLNGFGTLSVEELATTLKFIQEMTQKMSSTINEFMDFTKPDREKEWVNIKEVLMSVVKIIDAQLTTRNIALNIDIADDVQIYAHKKEFAHVLLNLLSNARDAFEEKEIPEKTITVRAYDEKEEVAIIVADNAGGIEADVIEKIFNPFFTTKEDGKGTGIGLFMSKKMVEEHFHGSMSVVNKDGGAEFKIAIPIKR